MTTKPVKMSDLNGGPILHQSLPDAFITRVKNYMAVLAEVEPASLETILNSFQRDENPETEIKVWERVAATYQWAVIGNPGLTGVQKKDVFDVLLGLSMGEKDFSMLENLSKEKIATIVEHFS